MHYRILRVSILPPYIGEERQRKAIVIIYLMLVCMVGASVARDSGRSRSRSPASQEAPAAPKTPPTPSNPVYSFESEHPSSPEAESPPESPTEAEAEAEAKEAGRRHTQRAVCELLGDSRGRAEAETIDLDLDRPEDFREAEAEAREERELFGSDESDASGDTLPPMSLPSSLFASPADSQESRPDDDVLLRRSVPPVAPPPPPPVIIVSASAPALNITFNNCASAAVIVRNHVG